MIFYTQKKKKGKHYKCIQYRTESKNNHGNINYMAKKLTFLRILKKMFTSVFQPIRAWS